MNLDEVREKLTTDAYVTFDEAENLYLTGFRASLGISVISKNSSFFFTDARYLESARKAIEGFKVIAYNGFIEFIQNLKSKKIKTITVDGQRMKQSLYQKLSQNIDTEIADGFLDEFREVKENYEVSLISKSVGIAEVALKSILHKLKPGITEMEFRAELIRAFLRFGGEGESFTTIVASGKGSAVPHWEASGKEIKDGDIVIVDFGTVYKGYVSDITRTFLVGNVSSELRIIYDVVREAQKKGIESVKAGKPCREIDKIVRNYISSKGYGNYFTHATGHGIGVEVHESPIISPRSDKILRENMVVTVEPGIYIPDLGGVRIEDDILVCNDRGVFQYHHCQNRRRD
ncbi:MAG: M24 family metallopeptidase [Nitrospiraceae bacterium]|nr:M24 family metallopeptidase [Nitrospiraceae bacterium]